MKKMGRNHRPFFRICAIDVRAPRDGKVIEELGIYDPLVKDTDARAILNGERIAYWLSVGALPSEKVRRADQEVRPGRHAPGRAAGGPGADQDDPPAGPGAVHSAAQAAGARAAAEGRRRPSRAPAEAAGEAVAEHAESDRMPARAERERLRLRWPCVSTS